MRVIPLLVGLFVAGWAIGLHAAPAAPTLADYRTTYEREQNKIRTNNAAVLAADADYLKALESLCADFKKQGDFDNVMAVTSERKRFEATRMVPEQSPDNLPTAIGKAQTDYRATLARVESERERQTAKLDASYMKALKELVKTYLNTDKMTEAEEANKELKRVETELKNAGFLPDALASKAVVVVGGTSTAYSLDGKRYAAWLFTDPEISGTFTVSGGSLVCDVLVVGGGGGGGAGAGGGGGAGGVTSVVGMVVTSGTYTVIVGNGGKGAVSTFAYGGAGSDSSAFSVVASGGGCGGCCYDYKCGNGISGGCGGGGAGGTPTAPGKGGTGTQGKNGGSGKNTINNFPGGGGGGAGSSGADATGNRGGNGGSGISSSLGGTATIYGGGGGGGSYVGGSPANVGAGGNGGGGIGGANGAGGGNGTANTGGGGGGGGRNSDGSVNNVGGAGGSGIVIVRYLSSGS